jgi:PAS domain S-box-containing protein
VQLLGQRFSSLRIRVLLLVLATGLPAILLIIGTFYAWQHYEYRESQMATRHISRLVASNEESAIASARQIVERLAKIPGVQHGDAATCSRLLQPGWALASSAQLFGVLDASGHLVCATRTPADPDISHLPHVRRAVETKAFTIAGTVNMAHGTGAIGLAQPALDETGRITAVVFAMIDLTGLDRLTAGTEHPDGTILTLVDDTGTILFHEPHSRQWVGKSMREERVFEAMVARRREGFIDAEGPDGIRRMFSFQPLLPSSDGGNVYVIAGVDPRVAFATVNQIMTVSLAGLGLALAIGLVGAWVGADAVVLRNLDALLRAARRLAAGDLTARSGVISGASEVRQLAGAFDDMAMALEARQREADEAKNALAATHQELEIRIQLRTSDLVKANDALHAALVERERAEEALKKLSSALEQTADSVIITRRDGVIEYVNPAFEALTGYGAADVLGKTPRILKSGVHDRAFYGTLWRTILSGQVYRAVVVNRKREGLLYFEAKTITPLRNNEGDITHFISTGRDITEQKRAEEDLRESREGLRLLAGHLESIREDERSRISREIHDELGQVLTGLKFDLSRLVAKPPEDRAELIERVDTMLQLMDQTIRSVRRIATELRPGVLDDLGLEAAIEWQSREFQERTGIRCRFVSTLADAHLPDELATAVFRILQETLTNVARHSGASSVNVALKSIEGRLILTVRDDGKGISEEEAEGRRSLGLLGMRERALLLGGYLTVTGRPGRGTTVVLDVQLPPNASRPEVSHDSTADR